MRIAVESRFEPTGEELPDAFYLGSRRISIVDINDRWLSHDYSYFKVIGENREIYILRHDKTKRIWEMTLFNASPSL
jgi:hypothetical protein